MSRAIGIDLGTTNSCVCVIEGGQPVIIPNAQGQRTTPSVVAFAKDGERLVGERALRQAAVNPDRTVLSVKRHMGSSWSIPIDGKNYIPQEISAMILRQLKADAEDYLGGSVTDAVITVPAYFNDVQRQATKDAGRIAGLNVLRIINEPTSAALAYGLDNGQGQKILVFDLGGGTFDVSVIEIGDGVIEVLATSGDNHLGGDDFDDRLVGELVRQVKEQAKTDIRRDVAAMQRIREAAVIAKIELSTLTKTQISLPYLCQVKGEMFHFETSLTRARFEALTKDLIDRTEGPVRTALADAGIASSQLGKVLLVGGSTRIPAVQEKVRALTGMIPSKNINPDECVAQGAAIQADTLSGQSTSLMGMEKDRILLLDVTPLSLSIETVGGVATRLVEKNTTLPVRYSKIFSTAAPFQTTVEINVLQGERPMARDNKSIGKFRLNGIKRAPAGVPQIEVTFDIDTNGILKVSAKDLGTGREQSVTISASDRMSDAEVEQAIRDAAMYASEDSIRRQSLRTVHEAGELVEKVKGALKEGKKSLSKEQVHQIKFDLKALQALAARKKPEKMVQTDLDQIRQAMETLKASAGEIPGCTF